MIFWPQGAFWPFLFFPETCAGETNARHPSIHVFYHRYQQTPRNCQEKLVAAILMHIMTKKGKKWPIFTDKNALKNNFLWVFGHLRTQFSTLVNFSSTLGTYWIFLGQKKLIDFSPPFNPYFTARLTSKSNNGPLKVLPEGSMVEYLPVGSQEAPPNHFWQKIISSPRFLNHTPSPLCSIPHLIQFGIIAWFLPKAVGFETFKIIQLSCSGRNMYRTAIKEKEINDIIQGWVQNKWAIYSNASPSNVTTVSAFQTGNSGLASGQVLSKRTFLSYYV